MSIHVALHHVTRYRYDRLVQLGPQIVRLRPAPHCRTPILSYSMTVEPAQHFVNWQQDPFANYMARLVFPERTRTFEIAIDLVAEMSVYNPFDFFLEERAQAFPFDYGDALRRELAPYLACDPQTSASDAFRSYVESIDRAPAGTVDFLVALNRRLQRDIRYVVRLEPG
ncbi:transglutaminase N-terminal domain-containing protein, partial [Burkholderia thailandensis]